jgi:hypothetical protein
MNVLTLSTVRNMATVAIGPCRNVTRTKER